MIFPLVVLHFLIGGNVANNARHIVPRHYYNIVKLITNITEVITMINSTNNTAVFTVYYSVLLLVYLSKDYYE